MLVFNPSKLSRKAMLAVMYVLITTRLFNYSFSPNKNELLCISLLIQVQMKKNGTQANKVSSWITTWLAVSKGLHTT